VTQLNTLQEEQKRTHRTRGQIRRNAVQTRLENTRRRESRPKHRRSGSLVGGQGDGYLWLGFGAGLARKRSGWEAAAAGVI